MAANYPICKVTMLKISGVGEVKYSKYGEAFEEAIKEFTDEHNIEVPNYEENVDEVKIQVVKDNDLKLEVTTDLELYNRLHAARGEFAKKEKVAPQAIITMNSLKEISGRYPITVDKLKDVSGMGPKKISSYGDTIIKIVNDYLSETNKDTSFSTCC